MAECQLPKLNVAGSIPVSRSIFLLVMHVYILHSASLDRHYVGMGKNAYRRSKQHVRGQSKWTSRADDWELTWQTSVPNRAAAVALDMCIEQIDPFTSNDIIT